MLSKFLLQKLYIKQEKSSNIIAKELKYSACTIQQYLKKYNLTRTKSEAAKIAYKHNRWKSPKIQRNEFARKYNFNQQFFRNWNSQMAYILGFIIADGHITKRDNCLILVQKDKDLLIRIREIIGPNRISFQNGSWRLAYSSIIMKEDLAKLGLESKQFSLESFKKIPKNLIYHFIRGVFDGDGYICHPKNPKRWISGFVAAREDFLYWIFKRIPAHGGRIRKQSKASCYTLALGQRDTVYLEKFLYFSLSKNDLWLRRKKDLFNKLLEEKNNIIKRQKMTHNKKFYISF